jgi:hypothetical protein
MRRPIAAEQGRMRHALLRDDRGRLTLRQPRPWYRVLVPGLLPGDGDHRGATITGRAGARLVARSRG